MINDLALSWATYEIFQRVHASHPADLIDTIQYDTVHFQVETHDK